MDCQGSMKRKCKIPLKSTGNPKNSNAQDEGYLFFLWKSSFVDNSQREQDQTSK